MRRSRRLWLAAACVSLLPSARSQGPSVPERLPGPGDLRPLLAQVRRQRAPLLLLFSTPGCPYCREVRANYLGPRVADQARRSVPELLIRVVEIANDDLVIDGEGRRLSETELAARFGVRVVPVVVLVDDRLQLLVEPLIGLDRSGFYEATLADRIERAQRAIRR